MAYHFHRRQNHDLSRRKAKACSYRRRCGNGFVIRTITSGAESALQKSSSFEARPPGHFRTRVFLVSVLSLMAPLQASWAQTVEGDQNASGNLKHLSLEQLGDVKAVERCLRSRGGAAPPRSILVVEDDPSTLEVIVELLQGYGYAVSTATDGAQARSSVAQSLPELVILEPGPPQNDWV
jgi:hypothetical protein